MRRAFVNGKIFTGNEFIHGKAVVVDNGVIHSIVPEMILDSSFERIDLGGNILAPAFMDIQVYGGNGKLFSEFPSVEAVKSTYASCLEGGATHILPTISTNTLELMLEGIEAVKEYWKEGGSKGVMGVHLEGPWLSVSKKGAHREDCIRKPTRQEVEKLLEVGKDVIKLITLAPEECDEEIIDMLKGNGIAISAGHSNASYEQGMNGYRKIGLATHLFNAMSPFQHRAPGMVGAIYDSPTVSASVVADGHHVDFSVIRISKHLMGARLFLITDAVTESFQGHYQHRLQGDKYVLPNGTLSGSSLTMMKAVRNCVEKVGISLEESLRMGSLYPAKAIGMDSNLGRIENGYTADLVEIGPQLEVKEIYVAGAPIRKLLPAMD
jgi:N-acetylglucosamine-6-phosphate deacetylase